MTRLLEMNVAPNKSTDVSAKQRLCYQTGVVTFGGLGSDFAPRQFNRSAARARLGFLLKIEV